MVFLEGFFPQGRIISRAVLDYKTGHLLRKTRIHPIISFRGD